MFKSGSSTKIVQVLVISVCALSLFACSKKSNSDSDTSSDSEQQPTITKTSEKDNIDYYAGAQASLPKIEYASTVSTFTKTTLTKDFEFLSKILIQDDQSADLRSVMKINSSDPQSLVNWLETRVKKIVPPDYDDNSYSTYIPLSQIMDGPESAVTIASNLGGSLYKYAKSKNQYVSLAIPGLGSVDIRSPRVGIIREGNGLMKDFYGWGTLGDVAHMMFRLATLFHEGRHSDGNGPSLVFSHVKCPKGHALAGDYACDNNKNGPYTIGANVIKSFLNSCAKCSEKTKSTLRVEAADMFSRVLSNDIWDDTPESI